MSTTSCTNTFLGLAAFAVIPLSKIRYDSYLRQAATVCGSGQFFPSAHGKIESALLPFLAPSTLGKESEDMKKL